MIRSIALCAPLLVALFAPALAQEEVERRFAVDPDAYVKVFVQDGSVRVTGWTKDSIAVTGTVARGELFAGGEGRNAKLGVWTDTDTAPGSARLIVRVPASATVWVKSESADARVAGVDAGVDVYSVTGAVRIEGEPRQVYAESMGGAVEIAADSPSVRAKSAAGEITFRGDTRDLTLSSVSGAVRVETDRPVRARLETVSGTVQWTGGIDRGGALDVITHDGSAVLDLPADVDADLEANTVRGSITLAREGANRVAAERLDVVLGAGGARVTVRTFSGDVRLRTR
ncbi:MAG: DUF4097 family beta strand repeat-containing protein [Gemmatimonadota bacterium]|nr:DUF4097 family beta strand repeat-containing protein [Gemmatimonadota bacterium]